MSGCVVRIFISVTSLEFESKVLKLVIFGLQTLTQVKFLVHVLEHKVKGVVLGKVMQLKGIEVV